MAGSIPNPQTAEGVAEAMSLAEIMERVSDELVRMAGISDDVQAALGAIIDDPERTVMSEAHRLQRIDVLSQTAHALATCFRSLAEDAAAGRALDLDVAAGKMRLAEVAARISTNALHNDDTKESGDCDFF